MTMKVGNPNRIAFVLILARFITSLVVYLNVWTYHAWHNITAYHETAQRMERYVGGHNMDIKRLKTPMSRHSLKFSFTAISPTIPDGLGPWNFVTHKTILQ